MTFPTVSRLFYGAAIAISGFIMLKSTIDALTKDIIARYANTKTKPKYNTTTETHHMVAKSASAAQPARNVLATVGISIEHYRNKIQIKTGLNRRLNSGLYYSFVNSLMNNAFSKSSITSARKDNVFRALEIYVLYLSAFMKMEK